MPSRRTIEIGYKIHTKVDITETAASDLAANAVLVTDTQILCMMSAPSDHPTEASLTRF